MSACRLLLVSHGVGRSGYARFAKGILSFLHPRIEAHHYAIDVHAASPEDNWAVHVNTLEGDPHGHRRFRALVDSVRPDIVLVHHEPWVYTFYDSALADHAARARMAFYCPIEGTVSRPAVLSAALEADNLVTQTEFGANEILKSADRVGQQLSGHLTNIPCGIDSDVFYPLTSGPRYNPHELGQLTNESITRNRQVARSILFPEREDVQDAFVVLNANYPSMRKRLDVTLEGFATFARTNPRHAMLCFLRCDPGRGYFASELYSRLFEEGRILEVPFSRGPISDVQLNLLYNACDVGINTASAEGWGLFSYEHAATGAAQLVPDYAGPGETWAEVGLCLEVDHPVAPPGEWFKHRPVKPKAVTDALSTTYAQWQAGELGFVSLACYRHATQSRLQWETIATQWSELLLDAAS